MKKAQTGTAIDKTSVKKSTLKGSVKNKPTKQMLQQEKKIKAKSKK